MPGSPKELSGSTRHTTLSSATVSSRRRFFVNAGSAALIAGLIPSCQKIRELIPKHDSDNETIDLGTGDTGITNYCYLLQQLEAAYYSKVVQNPFANIREEETANLISIYNHEIAHREFYRNLLSNNAIPVLNFKFNTIDFKKGQVVWQTAKTFEDLVVAAYGGIANRIADETLSLSNSKVLSVDARHAAAVADLGLPGSFAEAVSIYGLDPSWTPSQVMAVAQLYIVNKIDFSGITF